MASPLAWSGSPFILAPFPPFSNTSIYGLRAPLKPPRLALVLGSCSGIQDLIQKKKKVIG